MKRLLKATGLIIPHAGLPKIDKGAILTTTTIVRFTRVPMGACSDGGSVGPGPLALVTFVSGSNPRQFSCNDGIIESTNAINDYRRMGELISDKI